jgi:lipopolysaccharide transport system ATP-binding protein
MADTVITAEDVSKLYRIGLAERRHESLVGATLDWLKTPYRNFRKLRALDTSRASANGKAESDDLVWAVREVAFEVERGEVLGIIGRNGAGKSTLLKILSRITEPTSGRIRLRGRVSALLEVGTGFHPELTGRENVYLNGTILGMTKREIDRKFDEIVDFSGVERFLDTPVKRYSSGMQVRLAFGVAAHLEPEILIVDEVLAVGDAEFQKKCLGKMSDVVHEGRTVLFVSHNMSTISGLCQRVLLMEHGRLTFDGSVGDGIARYLQAGANSPSVDLSTATHRMETRGEYGRFTSVSLFDSAGRPCDSFAMGDALVVEMEVECIRRLYPAEVGLLLINEYGQGIHYLVSAWEGLELELTPGRHRFRVTVPRLLVHPGKFGLTLWLSRQNHAELDDWIVNAIQFMVVGADVTGYGPNFERYTFSKCEVYCPSEWSYVSEIDELQHQDSRVIHD